MNCMCVVAINGSMVTQARRLRKMLGGGMRQAGVLAAAGVIVLEHHVPKLAQDHANAKAIARGLARIPGVSIEGGLAAVETNIMFVNLSPVRSRFLPLFSSYRIVYPVLMMIASWFRSFCDHNRV